MECEGNLRKAKQVYAARCEEYDKAKTAASRAEEEGGGSIYCEVCGEEETLRGGGSQQGSYQYQTLLVTVFFSCVIKRMIFMKKCDYILLFMLYKMIQKQGKK